MTATAIFANHTPLTKDDECELFAAAQNGDIQAQEKIVNHYIRFAYKAANESAQKRKPPEDVVTPVHAEPGDETNPHPDAHHRMSAPVLNADDQTALAHDCLLKAIQSFDCGNGVKFATYLGTKIRLATYDARRKQYAEFNKNVRFAEIEMTAPKVTEHGFDQKDLWEVRKQAMIEYLDQTPKDIRTIIQSHIGGEALSEIAARIGLKSAHTQQIWHRWTKSFQTWFTAKHPDYAAN